MLGMCKLHGQTLRKRRHYKPQQIQLSSQKYIVNLSIKRLKIYSMYIEVVFLQSFKCNQLRTDLKELIKKTSANTA